MGSHDVLPDDVFELILLSLHSQLWLLRAASTCKRWRRVISSADFPRRFRAIHNILPVVGYYYNKKIFIFPRFEPSPSAPAVDHCHFSLDFLPGHNTTNWMIKDSRGSLLLLYRGDYKTGVHDLVVCEPLTWHHEVIPPLTPPSRYQRWSTKAVLLDGEEDTEGGGISMFNFMVLCLVEHDCIDASMFTSGSSWRRASIDRIPMLYYFGVVAGRWYWYNWKKKVVNLDQSTLEFSSFMLPADNDIGCVTLTIGRDGAGNNLKIFARRQGGSGEEWALEKTIQLSAAILGLPQLGRFCLTWHPPEAPKVKIRVPAPWREMRFLLDMETMEAELLLGPDVGYMPDYDSRKAYPYEFPWPPSLRACCTDNNAC